MKIEQEQRREDPVRTSSGLPRSVWIVLTLVIAGLAILISLRDRGTKDTRRTWESVGYSRDICDDGWKTVIDHSNDSIQYFDLTLRPGCFSGWVSIPKTWQVWDGQFIGDKANTWHAIWYANWTGPQGPWAGNQRGPDFHNVDHRFRIEGRGTVRVYVLSPTGKQLSENPPDAGVKDAVDDPRSGPVAVEKDADVFRFGFWPCRRYAAAVVCTGFVRNEYREVPFAKMLLTTAHDDLGNEYIADEFKIGRSSCLEREDGCRNWISPKASEAVELKLHGVVAEAKAVVIAIHVTMTTTSKTEDLSITVPIAPQKKPPSE